MQKALQPLRTAVQRNCHIADARHAGDYTLCIYLLKMREYFRWEKGYSFQDILPDTAVGDWLKDREAFWRTLEDEVFADVPVNGDRYDPFDSSAINAALNPHGLVYSGGIGNRNAPHFFLGRLKQCAKHADFSILVADHEYARDLTAPPAMALGTTILVRRESLRRLIWEKIEEWRWSQPDNAMGRAMHCYDFAADAHSALEQMTDAELDSALLHEKGEVLAGQRLGPDWEEMLSCLPHSRAALMTRAVRDHLADALSTLPALVRDGEDASLHFYFANLASMRRHLFPSLSRAYETWVASGDRSPIATLIPVSRAHWDALALQMLDLYRSQPDDLPASLRNLIGNSRL
jgi:hypothetical protein